MKKIPQITLAFWVMKICATTLGETGGDLFSMTMHLGYAVSALFLMGLFVIALTSQLLSKTYHSFLYWTVILATSTAGTTISDYMDRTLGPGYVKGSCILGAILLTLFAFWRFSTASLSVKHITTLKVEILYWMAILFSNTLGTALGDFLADASHLGFAGGALLIAGLLGLVIYATFFSTLSKTLLFWLAFVLTRPFGATMGDLLTKAKAQGGLGFGTVGSSCILASILVFFILFTTYPQLVSGKADAQGGLFKRNWRIGSNLMRIKSGFGKK
jgi:uncharacterized membrane-anchored protein